MPRCGSTVSIASPRDIFSSCVSNATALGITHSLPPSLFLLFSIPVYHRMHARAGWGEGEKRRKMAALKECKTQKKTEIILNKQTLYNFEINLYIYIYIFLKLFPPLKKSDGYHGSLDWQRARWSLCLPSRQLADTLYEASWKRQRTKTAVVTKDG